jgi:cobalt-zinc-cadmium efflux system protein
MANTKNKDTSSENIRFSFYINLTFAIIEIIGGLLTNSLIIFSNAIHDVGDSLSLGISWHLEKISKKPVSDSYTYGFKRYSLLAALISAALILASSFFVIIEAISRLFSPPQINGKSLLIFGFLGLFFNGLAILKLLRSKSYNEKFAMLHLLDDVLGWAVVVVVSIIIMLSKNLYILDPIFSTAISIYLIFIVIKNTKEVLNIFLQAVPKNMDIGKIKNVLLTIKDIKDVHDAHIWTMDGNYNVFSIHITVDKGAHTDNYNSIKKLVRASLESCNIQHATIEICREDEFCEFNPVKN